MKRVVASILCLVLMISSFAFAAEVTERPDFSIFVNGVAVDKTDVPIVIDGRTLVPLRTLAVALGVPNDNEHIIWLPDTREVVVIGDNVVIELVIDSTEAVVNENIKVIDVPATVYNGRTYLPARFVAEAFDKNVGWDATTNTVTIDDKVEISLGEADSDVVAILKKSREAMQNIKSAKVDTNMTMDINAQGLPITVALDGTVSMDMNKKQVYGDFDMTANMMGMTMPAEMQMYLENDKMYMRTVAEGEDSGWIDSSEELSAENMDIWTMAEEISKTTEISQDMYAVFEKVGVENGVTIIKIKEAFKDTLETMLLDPVIKSMSQENPMNIDLTEFTHKMYINNSTNYTDKLEIGMGMNVEAQGEKINMDIDMVMNMSEFNAVNITKPAM